MILTVHAITGGAIGEMSENIWVAFLAGFILHLFLDAIPHFDNVLSKKNNWNRAQYFFSGFDLFLTIYIVLTLHFADKTSLAFWSGLAGSTVIDVLDNTPFWKKRFRKTPIGIVLNKLHSRFHPKKQAKVLPSLLFQAFIIVGSIIIVELIG